MDEVKELMKAQNKDGKNAYKVYEKLAKKLDLDVKDQDNEGYWKIDGESITDYGHARIRESRETLAGKIAKRNRPEYMNKAISQGIKKELLKIFPDKCPECGFHRFMEIMLVESSLGQAAMIICPNCRKELAEINEDY